MRRALVAAAALALLASACGVAVEGAPCSAPGSCPAGQGCGATGRCSERAARCATACPVGATRCASAGDAIEACRASEDGVCASWDASTCGASRACEEAGGGPRCVCAADPRCPGEGTSCSQGGVVTCRSIDGCVVVESEVSCGAAQVCRVAGATATCACPSDGDSAGQGCSRAVVDQTACDPQTGDVLACRQVGACRVWELAASCSSSGLRCGRASGTSACECPANPGPDYYADAAAGGARGVSPYPSGVASPPACRFRKLGDALSAAIAASTPATPTRAVAAGWSGQEVVFSGELLPLDVPAGVTLTTADDALTVTHYTIAADVPSVPAVILRAGARLSGFKVRAALPTGSAPAAGVAVTCAAADAEAHVHAVRVEGTAAGMKTLANAMTVSGPCPVTVADAWFGGAFNDGVVVQGTAGDVAFHGATFTTNGKSGLSVAGGRVTVDGPSAFRANKEHGLALRAGAVVVTGGSDAAVEFAANVGDGILAGVDGAACQLAVTGASIHDNGNAAANPPTGAGIEIVNNDAQGAGGPFSIARSTLAANAAAGLKVLRSSPRAGGPSLAVDSVAIAGGVNGVLVQPTPSGSVVHAALTNLTVTGASDGGILLNQASGSDVTLAGSTISGNCASTPRTLAKQLGGGVVFLGSLPAMHFAANKVTGNQFDQILVASSSADTLTLGGGACGSANLLVCSKDNPPATAGGAPRIGFGIRSTGAPVAATFNAWTSDPPDSSRDFAGNVDADGAGPSASSEYCTPAADGCVAAPISCAPNASGSTGSTKAAP